jgi:hypothetical protein
LDKNLFRVNELEVGLGERMLTLFSLSMNIKRVGDERPGPVRYYINV